MVCTYKHSLYTHAKKGIWKHANQTAHVSPLQGGECGGAGVEEGHSLYCLCVCVCVYVPVCVRCSVVQLYTTPWTVARQAPHSPGNNNTGMGCHSLLQGIFQTQVLNSGLLHCRQILYLLSYLGSPCTIYFCFIRMLYDENACVIFSRRSKQKTQTK